MVRYETRPAAATEQPSVPAAFALDSWRADDPSLPDGVPESLEPSDVVVGATFEGDLVGYCVVSPRDVFVREIGAVVEPSGVYLWDLYVQPAYRGRGLGTALLRRARAESAVPDGDTIEALVALNNHPSRQAFRSAGFEPTERLVSVGLGDRRYRRTRPLGGGGQTP